MVVLSLLRQHFKIILFPVECPTELISYLYPTNFVFPSFFIFLILYLYPTNFPPPFFFFKFVVVVVVVFVVVGGGGNYCNYRSRDNYD